MILRPTTLRDLESFSPSPEDLAEAQAAGHPPAFPDVTECVTLSCYGKPLAIGGHQGDQCWFVTDKDAWRLRPQGKRMFRKLIIQYRDELLKQYPVIWNFVWVGNTHHIRFLKTIGAVFHDEFTMGGEFQLFTIRR